MDVDPRAPLSGRVKEMLLQKVNGAWREPGKKRDKITTTIVSTFCFFSFLLLLHDWSSCLTDVSQISNQSYICMIARSSYSEEQIWRFMAP